MSGLAEIKSQTPDYVSIHPPEWILDCAFVLENAAALALGALEENERFRIAHHLSWCPMCAQLVHEMRKTVGYLPYASPQVPPPPSSKVKLFDRVRADQRAVSANASVPLIHTLNIPAPSINDRPSVLRRSVEKQVLRGNKSTVRNKRFQWEFIAAPLAAVPLMLALAIVGGWALRTQERYNDLAAESRAFESENAELSNEVAWLNYVIGSDQSKWTLSGAQSEIGSTAGGQLTTASPVSKEVWASLEVWNLPTTNAEYQVLLETKDGKMHRAARFPVDQSGKAVVELDVSSPLESYRAIHVKPIAAGSSTSTSDSLTPTDVLWMDMQSNLGSQGGTEANARAN